MTAPTVGIIGSGQLARMTAQAAISLAVDTKVLAATATDPACVAATSVEMGDPADAAAIRQLARGCDVVTFDHERVRPALLDDIESAGANVRPSAAVLRLTDKAHQRTVLSAHGFQVPPFALVTTAAEIDEFASVHGWPVVAKTAVGGYDGRGVFVLGHCGEAVALVEERGGRCLVVEPMLDLLAEVAVLVARRPSGETVVYPAVSTTQQDGICIETVAPAVVDPSVGEEARATAAAIAETIGSTGILAVELFVTPAGLLVNELAPRPHNSGHWTIEGAVTSQFENHLRGVLDWPLGDASITAPAIATVNVLGPAMSRSLDRAAALGIAGAHLHLYAKRSRPGRKIGHITATGPNPDAALHRARAALAALLSQPETPHKEIEMTTDRQCRVAVVMGSISDHRVMAGAVDTLQELDLAAEVRVLSAHRTPLDMLEFGTEAADRGIQVIIAGAGGAAHLPGMLAATTRIPVIGVPIGLKSLHGIDSLLSIVQMPSGVPVATVAIDGARNAAHLAARIVALTDPALAERIDQHRRSIADASRASEAQLEPVAR